MRVSPLTELIIKKLTINFYQTYKNEFIFLNENVELECGPCAGLDMLLGCRNGTFLGRFFLRKFMGREEKVVDPG